MSRDGFPAVRTKTIGGLERHTTKGALKVSLSMSFKRLSGFGRKIAATPAFKKRDPLFDPEKGQEKERQIMILPFQPGLRETTGGALPGCVVNGDFLWLNAGNNKKHGLIDHLKLLTGKPTTERQQFHL